MNRLASTCARIAVDAMGGDRGIDVTLPGAIAALRCFQDLTICLYGCQAAVTAVVDKIAPRHLRSRITIVHADEVVEMDEAPASALRSKKSSSMRLGINAVKDGSSDAFVSAGNTGALMAISKVVLKTIDGIDRPAICAPLPSLKGPVYTLDLGANLQASAYQLTQFALMGSALVEVLRGNTTPSIGLMNVGSEEVKGVEIIKQTHQMLREGRLNYQGYVEGDDLFSGRVGVVVTNGLEGNVALKASEGAARLFNSELEAAFKASWYSRFAGMVAFPALGRVNKSLSPSRYNGASLLGLQGVVVKSHGAASEEGFLHAIKVAYREVRFNIVEHISSKLDLGSQQS